MKTILGLVALSSVFIAPLPTTHTPSVAHSSSVVIIEVSGSGGVLKDYFA